MAGSPNCIYCRAMLAGRKGPGGWGSWCPGCCSWWPNGENTDNPTLRLLRDNQPAPWHTRQYLA